jgi:hypothetical protein
MDLCSAKALPQARERLGLHGLRGKVVQLVRIGS